MSSKVPNSDSEAQGKNKNRGERLSFSRYALFFFPFLIAAGTDLATKSYMFGRYFDPLRADSNSPEYARQARHWWIEGIFGIETSTNPGALFGMGSGYSWLFASFSVVALIGILVWLFFFGALRDRWLTFSLGLICGGILGNLYDRVGLGYLPSYPLEIKYNVRDWVLFELKGVPFFEPWPNFNIADACLVCGAIMLFIHAFCYAQPPVQEEESVASSS